MSQIHTQEINLIDITSQVNSAACTKCPDGFEAQRPGSTSCSEIVPVVTVSHRAMAIIPYYHAYLCILLPLDDFAFHLETTN